MEVFFRRGTKSGKKKNLGTKMGIGSKCRDQNVFFAFFFSLEYNALPAAWTNFTDPKRHARDLSFAAGGTIPG